MDYETEAKEPTREAIVVSRGRQGVSPCHDHSWVVGALEMDQDAQMRICRRCGKVTRVSGVTIDVNGYRILYQRFHGEERATIAEME